MLINKTDGFIEITIESKKVRFKMLVCLLFSVATLALSASILWIPEEITAVKILAEAVFLYISFTYLDGFFWHLRGKEVFTIQNGRFYFYKKSLTRLSSKTGDAYKAIYKLYDKNVDEDDPPPRGNAYIGAYGGKILVRYAFEPNPIQKSLKYSSNRFFRFGINVSDEEARQIIDDIQSLQKPA